VDDGTMPGGFGTSPFDGEGVPTRRTVVIDHGTLNSYVLNTYTAKKLGLQTTGNAARGLAGNPGIGPGNFFLQPGSRTPKQMLADIDEGLYVTEFLGFGVNMVTGDYSRGAAGYWVEGGEIRFPVEEITIAGNLKEMFKGIAAIGSDVLVRSGRSSGSILIENMTIAGD
jgi:PmbA protein